MLEHAHTLLYDLPGPYSDSSSRHRLADAAMALLELRPLVAAGTADETEGELPLDLQTRCDEMSRRLQHLPLLPPMLQRGMEDGLRKMCIASAALVRVLSVGMLASLIARSRTMKHCRRCTANQNAL